jgi:hypothetical protein
MTELTAQVEEMIQEAQPATRTRCATIGCEAPPTHSLVWTWPSQRDQVERDEVCAECGAAYLRRPALRAMLHPLPTAVPWAGFLPDFLSGTATRLEDVIPGCGD